MNTLNSIIGNERLIRNLKKSIEEKNDSHAYLIVSEDEITRREIAFKFAEALLCLNYEKNGDICNECKSCKAFNSSHNVDFRYISKEDEKFISINKIRENVINDAVYAPTENKYKIYVIDEADLMNENAQNAILKTLEEPKEYVKILLLASKENAMLPTILSRCITLKVMPLNDEEIKKWATLNLDEIEDKEALGNLDYYVKYASGNVTNLVKILKNTEFKRLRNVGSEIADKLLTGKFLDFARCKDILNSEKDNITELLNILEIWYRDVYFYKNNLSDMIINYDSKEVIRNHAKMFNEEKLENAIKSIKQYKEDISNYANFKLATEMFQINVSEV